MTTIGFSLCRFLDWRQIVNALIDKGTKPSLRMRFPDSIVLIAEAQQGVEDRSKHSSHLPFRKDIRLQICLEHERREDSPEGFTGRTRGATEKLSQCALDAVINALVNLTNLLSYFRMASRKEFYFKAYQCPFFVFRQTDV